MEGIKPPEPKSYKPKGTHPFLSGIKEEQSTRRKILKRGIATAFATYVTENVISRIPSPQVTPSLPPDVGTPNEINAMDIISTPLSSTPSPDALSDKTQMPQTSDGISNTQDISRRVLDFDPSQVQETNVEGRGGVSKEATTEKTLQTQLVEIYGNQMDSKRYKTYEDKEAVMTKIIEQAQEIDPNQPNLARQITAVISSKTYGTFEDVRTYLEHFNEEKIAQRLGGRDNIGDVLMATVDIDAIGKPLDAPIRSQHSGHDLNLDEYVSKAEEVVIPYYEALQKGEKPENLFSSEQIKEMQPILALYDQVREIRSRTTGEWAPGAEIRNMIEVANSDVIQKAARREREGHPPEHNPLGAILMTLDKSYFSQFEDERSKIMSNADLTTFFSNNPDYFDEIKLDVDAALNHLPVGSFIIFNPNKEGSDEFIYDKGQGRSVIVKANRREDQASMNGNDRESLLAEDLSEMRAGYRVFVPIL